MRKILLLAGLLGLFDASTYAQSPYAGPPTAFKNMAVCGDATTCPWQRGTSIGSIANTATATADYWYAIGGASSSITVSQAAQAGVNGFTKAIQFARTAANTDTAVVHLGQVFDTADYGTSMQGKIVCWSFYTLAGANYSAINNAFGYKLYAGTGSNQGYASMVAGTWTGSTTPISGTVAITTLAQVSSACAQIPSNATEWGIDYFWTPGGTAGANDWVQLNRVQLESIADTVLSMAKPTAFENRSAGIETWLSQRRAWVLKEPAASISVAPSGQGASTTTCVLSVPFPTTMRAAPTLSATGTALSTLTWTITHVVTNTALATPFLAATTGGHTVNVANMTATVASGLTAGQTCTLTGAGGGSTLTFSADLL